MFGKWIVIFIIFLAIAYTIKFVYKIFHGGGCNCCPNKGSCSKWNIRNNSDS